MGSDALIGIIYNFNTNEIYSATKGHGAFLNNLKIKVSDITEKNKASLTTGFPASESLESSMEFLEGLKRMEKNKNVWKCSIIMCLCCIWKM